MVKMFEDALRSLEILKDDSPKYVTRTIIESYEANSKGNQKEVKSSRSKDVKKKGEDSLEIIIKSL